MTSGVAVIVLVAAILKKMKAKQALLIATAGTIVAGMHMCVYVCVCARL